MDKPEKSSEISEKQFVTEIKCRECLRVLWLACSSYPGSPTIDCPFKSNGECRIIADCGCDK